MNEREVDRQEKTKTSEEEINTRDIKQTGELENALCLLASTAFKMHCDIFNLFFKLEGGLEQFS